MREFFRNARNAFIALLAFTALFALAISNSITEVAQFITDKIKELELKNDD